MLYNLKSMFSDFWLPSGQRSRGGDERDDMRGEKGLRGHVLNDSCVSIKRLKVKVIVIVIKTVCFSIRSVMFSS